MHDVDIQALLERLRGWRTEEPIKKQNHEQATMPDGPVVAATPQRMADLGAFMIDFGREGEPGERNGSLRSCSTPTRPASRPC